ncbi:hypothetical protein LguiA_001909 [Lonicera macranthoides]
MAFILWMLFKWKLLTKVRLKNWGCNVDDNCVLCNADSKDVSHLFFKCCFTRRIWKEVLKTNVLRRDPDDWEGESAKAVVEIKGYTFLTKIRGVSLAAVVYFIWQERNYRVFNQEGHD